MKMPSRVALATFFLTWGPSAFAQPHGNPGGGFTWALVAGAFAAGVAVGYYIGKNSGKDGSDSGDGSDNK